MNNSIFPPVETAECGVIGLLASTLDSNHYKSARAPAPASINATAAAQAYDRFVAAHGMVFGFDAAHTHFNPYERMLTPTNVSGLKPAWTSPKVHIINSSPAVVNGVVYIGSDDWTFYALDANTGSPLWTFQTGGSVVSSPAVANGVVYVGSEDWHIYAVDASTGKNLWSFQTGELIVSSPTVVNGVVYIGSYDGKVYAFDLKSS